MSSEPSPVSIRLSNEDRELVAAVARYYGRSVSSIMRRAALAEARHILSILTPELLEQQALDTLRQSPLYRLVATAMPPA